MWHLCYVNESKTIKPETVFSSFILTYSLLVFFYNTMVRVMFLDAALSVPNRNVYSAGASPAQSGDESRTSRRYEKRIQ